MCGTSGMDATSAFRRVGHTHRARDLLKKCHVGALVGPVLRTTCYVSHSSLLCSERMPECASGVHVCTFIMPYCVRVNTYCVLSTSRSMLLATALVKGCVIVVARRVRLVLATFSWLPTPAVFS